VENTILAKLFQNTCPVYVPVLQRGQAFTFPSNFFKCHDFLICFQYNVNVIDEKTANYLQYMPEKVQADFAKLVVAPMPGLVKSVAVEVGQDVSFV
jgi:hypothetical protein